MAASQDDIFSLIKAPAPAPVAKAAPPAIRGATAADFAWDAPRPTLTRDQFYQDYKPQLWDIVEFARNYYNEESGRYEPLVGETETLVTAWLAYVAAKLGVIIRAYPGTGKTATANPIFDTIPPDLRLRILNLSDKGIWTAAQDINAAAYVYVGEWQKAAQNFDVVELVKDWGERRAAERRRTDVTERKADGAFGEHKTVLPPKPLLITVASADGKDDDSLNEQVLRRYPEVATDPSRAQTERVIAMKGAQWDPGPNGVFALTQQDKEKFRQHVRFMHETGYKHFIMPAGQWLLANTMPSDYPISRSMTDIFKSIVEGVAKFHHYDRIKWTNDDGVESLVCTPADFWYARRVYGNILLLNCLRVSAVGKEILNVLPKLQARVEGRYVATKDEKWKVSKVREELKNRGLSLEKSKVSKELKDLEFNCYVESDDTGEIRYFRSETTTSLDQHLSPELMQQAVDQVIAEAEKYSFAEEYVRRFCSDPIMIRDPLTGQELNILRDVPPDVDRSKPREAAAESAVEVKKTSVAASSKGTGLYAFSEEDD